MHIRRFLPLVAAFCYIGGSTASLVDEIVNAITHAVDCVSCHALLFPLGALAELGDNAFSDTIIAVCKTLNVSQIRTQEFLSNKHTSWL